MTESGVVYDNAAGTGPGNVTAIGEQTLTYDAFNQVTSKSATGTTPPDYTYIYDVNEERIGVQFGNTTHWTFRDFDNKPLIAFNSPPPSATQTQWTWVESFVWADGKMLMAERPTVGQLHYHVDHLGSTRVITDANGQLVAGGRIDYAPFGEEITTSGGELIKFTGHERDYDLSQPTNDNYLDYMHARYYDSRRGRFLSVDPVLGKPQQPQSWNRYAYVLNNPLRYTDPDGREHGQEPGFTKPLSQADWSDAPPVIKGAFYVEGVLASEAAAEFLGGWFTTCATVTRYMGDEEAVVARRTGNVPNVGRNANPRPTHVTTDKPLNSSTEAQGKYELPETPTHRATVPKDRVPGSLGPTPDGRPTTSGGGSQSATNQPIPVRPDEIKPLDQSWLDRVVSWFKSK